MARFGPEAHNCCISATASSAATHTPYSIKLLPLHQRAARQPLSEWKRVAPRDAIDNMRSSHPDCPSPSTLAIPSDLHPGGIAKFTAAFCDVSARDTSALDLLLDCGGSCYCVSTSGSHCLYSMHYCLLCCTMPAEVLSAVQAQPASTPLTHRAGRGLLNAPLRRDPALACLPCPSQCVKKPS